MARKKSQNMKTAPDPQGELGRLIESAARRGARLALAEIGLDDDMAGRDMRDLRNLLTGWRRVRREAARVLIGFGVRALLIFIITVAALAILVAGYRL